MTDHQGGRGNGNGEKKGELTSSDVFAARRELQEKQRKIASQQRDEKAAREKHDKLQGEKVSIGLDNSALVWRVKDETEKFLKENEWKIIPEIDAARDRFDKQLVIRQFGGPAVSARSGRFAPVLVTFFGDADDSPAGVEKRRVLKNWIGNKYAGIEGNEWPIVVDTRADYEVYIEWQPKERPAG
ncbi:MAG: hypothetical protein G01um10148_507 [Parcubacteria group bacterium Gr01-1014_8]|nr:MAG: hypothetical protein G01um10148_507 [Parcubacteria group bacterium Gr01-1014_8]